MMEFLQMGGYAFYVWMSYGLAALVLILNIVIPRQRRKAIITRLSALAKTQKLKE